MKTSCLLYLAGKVKGFKESAGSTEAIGSDEDSAGDMASADAKDDPDMRKKESIHEEFNVRRGLRKLSVE